MAKLTRRDLAVGITALALLPATSRAAGQGLRIRRDVGTLRYNDDDILALRAAIPRMRADGSWQKQIDIHADMRWAHHHNWRFLAWHRMQMLHFERIVARHSGHDAFAMPYWNWADDHAPPIFYMRGTPLYHAKREAGPTKKISDYVGLSVKVGNRDADFLGRPGDNFEYFFGAPYGGDPLENYMGSAEQYGHNLVHLFVGGDMVNLNTSPDDPMFWAHHSNVDRIWAEWSANWGDATYSAPWRREALSGFVDEYGADVPTVSAGEVINTEALGYRYDKLGGAAIKGREEIWPGTAYPDRLRETQRALKMNRLSPSSGEIYLPPELLRSLIGARGLTLDIAGFLEVAGDGYVVQLMSKSIDRSWTFKDDAVFAVPMGGMSGGVLGHRVQLESMIPRNERALGEGVYIEADAKPLGAAPRGSFVGLQSFNIEYDAELPFSG